MSAYYYFMSSRKFFAILAAIAVLFAPAFTSAGMAKAAVPDHHTRFVEKDHCDSATGEGQDKSAGKKACCGAMCTAVAVTPATFLVTKPLLGDVPVANLHPFPSGVPGELATPPPRAA